MSADKFPLPDDYFDGQKRLTQGAGGEPDGHLAKLLNLLAAPTYSNATRPAASTVPDGFRIFNTDDKDDNKAYGGKWWRNGIET